MRRINNKYIIVTTKDERSVNIGGGLTSKGPIYNPEIHGTSRIDFIKKLYDNKQYALLYVNDEENIEMRDIALWFLKAKTNDFKMEEFDTVEELNNRLNILRGLYIAGGMIL